MSLFPAAELASLVAEVEGTFIHRATWLVYGEAVEDAAGGRVEGWLASADPGTGQPTIPCKIVASMPALAVASVQVLEPIDIYYRGAVPLRIPLNVRDRLVLASPPLGDGLTYEIVDLDLPPTLLIQARFGCRRIA